MICHAGPLEAERFDRDRARVLVLVQVLVCDACLERSGLFGAELKPRDDRARRQRPPGLALVG